MNKTFTVMCLLAINTLAMNQENAGFKWSDYPDLAQQTSPAQKSLTLAQSSDHSCNYTYDRRKQPVDDFYSIVAGSSKYNDDDFTPDKSSLFWDDMGESHLEKGYKWKRLSEQFQGVHNHLWGAGGIRPNDIKQGGLGNCWVLSGASALAEKPGRVEKIFLNEQKELNAAGIYAVNLFTLGAPHTVVVDEWVPMKNGNTIFSKVASDGAMWMPILEKAFAKYHGNYSHLDGGWPTESVRTLYGSPGFSILHNKVTVEELWTSLSLHDGKDDIIQCVSHGTKSDAYANSDGIYYRHAYTTLGVVTLSNGVRLVRVRNPHGRDNFSGRWSDDSVLWTDKFKAEAGFQYSKQDGKIFMQLEDYHEQMSDTVVNYDTTGWGYDYFLKLNDQTVSPGQWSKCGAECTRHVLKVTSEVDQQVFLTGHTWQDRGKSESCEKQKVNHMMKRDGDQYSRSWRAGARQLKKFDMTAGQTIEVIMEMDFRLTDVPKDWSLVANGNMGGVTISHSDASIVTDHMTQAPPKSGKYTQTNVRKPDPVTPTPTPVRPDPTPTRHVKKEEGGKKDNSMIIIIVCALVGAIVVSLGIFFAMFCRNKAPGGKTD